MRLEMTTKCIIPTSTNIDPTYYESKYIINGTYLEVIDFQRYIEKYKYMANNALNVDASGEALSAS